MNATGSRSKNFLRYGILWNLQALFLDSNYIRAEDSLFLVEAILLSHSSQSQMDRERVKRPTTHQ